jgi:hypothetical protein
MSRKVRRVPFHLDAGGVKTLPPEEIRFILRGADDLSLLDKVEATCDRKYIPLLESWERVDYKKVQRKIRQVIACLKPAQARSCPGVWRLFTYLRASLR